MGSKAVQVLRTYPARLRRYPFAPHGERSIAHAYRRAFARARRLVYLEDQYLWSAEVAEVIADALTAQPRPARRGGRAASPRPLRTGEDRHRRTPAARQALRLCTPRPVVTGSQVYDLENDEGTPVYVHAKVVVVDDVWAMIGSDNLNRRSWTHDSELSIAVLDATRDEREPADPAGLGDGARVVRPRPPAASSGASTSVEVPTTSRTSSTRTRPSRLSHDRHESLEEWDANGRRGPRPPGRVKRHHPEDTTTLQRRWAGPLYRLVHDPDGRPLRDRIRRRP